MLRLKSLRIINGMTRKELAEKLGVSTSMIAAYEQNINEPSIAKLIILSDLFHVSIDHLVGNDDKKPI